MPMMLRYKLITSRSKPFNITF